MTAAYRMFNNEKVGFDEVLQPHIDATQIRVGAQPVVITASDTTELDLTRPQQQIMDVGPPSAYPVSWRGRGSNWT